MSNKILCGLVAIFISATFFADNNINRNVEKRQEIKEVKVCYTQRIDRTIRCLVAAGTPPSLITRRVTLLYQEMTQRIHEIEEEQGNYSKESF